MSGICPRSLLLAALVIALLIGMATFAPRGGAGDSPADAVAQGRADAICRRAFSAASRLPRPGNRGESIALARELARVLRWTASELRADGSDDLAWAHQRWAAAIDDLRQALRSGQGSPRAGATELVARREAAASAQTLRAGDCVRLAGRG